MIGAITVPRIDLALNYLRQYHSFMILIVIIILLRVWIIPGVRNLPFGEKPGTATLEFNILSSTI